MEKDYPTTFVFHADKLDEYQRGFVSGIMYFLSGKPDKTQRWARHATDVDDGDLWVKDLDCTTEQGLEIYKEIEKHFPGAIVEIS